MLKLAAAKAGWGKAMPAGSAQGIAVHESFGSFVAQVAEVSMKDGKVKVDRVVCAVDCGVAVNPDVIRAQMEGCIGFGLGAMLYSEIEVKNGPPAAAQPSTATRSCASRRCRRSRCTSSPATRRPRASASPGLPPLAPAVANAMARLGTARVRRLPLTRAGLVATLISEHPGERATCACVEVPTRAAPG